jgi:eukaryotic-like serine/threonine-protein kinase
VRDDTRAATERLSHALAAYPVDSMPPQDAPLLDLAVAFAALGDVSAAQHWLGRADAVRPPEAVRKERSYVLAEAWIALHQERYEDAVTLLQRTGRQYACTMCVAIPLARAWEHLQRPDSAVAQYRHYIETPRSGRHLDDALYLAHAYSRLGELYDAQGDRAAATRYYGEFVTLWRDADAELQPRVRAAERRLAALRGPG